MEVDLEISQDLNFQRREWVVQRVGWVVMAALIIAALLGVFGPGPLSNTTAGSESGPLRAEYYRFWRMASPMPLRLRLTPASQGQGEVGLWVSREYLEAMRVESVTPEPARVEAAGDHFIYFFNVAASAATVSVIFNLEADRMGPVSGKFGVDQRAAIQLEHFIYP